MYFAAKRNVHGEMASFQEGAPSLLDLLLTAIPDRSFSYGITDENTYKVQFSEPALTPQEEAAATEAYNSWNPGSLAYEKARKKAAVDTRTAQLLLAGFVWPTGSNHYFSLSQEAESWRNAMALAKINSALSYPISVSNLTNTAIYSVANATQFNAWFNAGVTAKRQIVDSGENLKAQIDAAANILLLDLVVDTR